MEHPDLNLLIHKSMSDERIRRAASRQERPAPSHVSHFRVITGTTLMAIGARIAASPRPVTSRQPLPDMSVTNGVRNA